MRTENFLVSFVHLNGVMDVNSNTEDKNQPFSGPLSDLEANKFNCCSCQVTFSRYFGLRRHMKNLHPRKYEEFLASFWKDYKYKCSSCSQRYKNIQKLKNHEKRVHQMYKVKPITLHQCSLCHKKFERKEIDSHFETEHDVVLKTETFSFNSYEEFSNWKLTIEKEAKCYFKTNTSKQIEDKSYHYFSCSRSGYFNSEGKGIRKLKLQGSKKIDAFCPAMMKLSRKKDECTGTFQSIHMGHENDLAHFTRNNKKRLNLGVKKSSKVADEDGNSMLNDGLQGLIEIIESSDTKTDALPNTDVNEQTKTILDDRRKTLEKKWCNILHLINHSNLQDFDMLESLIKSIEPKIETLQSYLKTFLPSDNS